MATGEAWRTYRCRRVIAYGGKCYHQMPIRLDAEDDDRALRVERYRQQDPTARPQLFMQANTRMITTVGVPCACTNSSASQ